MVVSTVTPAPGKVTRQVRLAPWSRGPGVKVSTGDWGASEPSKMGMTPVQEKVGGVPRLQAHGTVQVMFLGWPDCRRPWKLMSG